MARIPLATVLGLVVAVVWAVVFLADIVLASYEAAPEVNLVMMVVVGGVFAVGVVKRGPNGG